MPGETMTLIQTIEVGAGGSSAFSFTSIPQTYTDLVVVHSTRQTGAVSFAGVNTQFNSSATGYSSRRLYGTGSGVASDSQSGNSAIPSGDANAASSTSNTFTTVQMYIPNYTGSANKSTSSESVSEANASAAYQFIVAGLWANSAAITTVSITSTNGNFAQYSTASLYGVLKGSGGATVS
jgi:hypothetical protein